MPIVRRSKKRDAMLELLRATKAHPSADWVYQQLRKEYPDVSLGTVYRNLNQLAEEGLIKRAGVVNGQERFDGSLEAHSHFICNRCGTMLDLPDCAPGAETESYSEIYGFVEQSHEFNIRGLCRGCAAL